jgi:peptidoglycan/LPS O-acetylase OafA/YrhL
VHNPRILAVESVRGIAALAVSGLHAYVYWTHFRVPRAPDNLAPDPYRGDALHDILRHFFVGSGASAVTMFFVISGFVLVMSLNKEASTSKFICSRAFRIYPAHIAVVIVWFLTAPWLLYGAHTFSIWDAVQSSSFAYAQSYFPMNGPTWSLRVEVAAIPVILLAWFIRRHLGIGGLICFALILAGFSFARDLYSADMIGRYAFVFVAGMLVVDLRSLVNLSRGLAILLICIAMTVDIAARPLLGYHAQMAILVEAICCVVTLALVVNGTPLNRFLHSSPVRGFGRISYSFFLIHFPVLWAFLRWMPDLPLSAVPAGLLTWGLVVAVTLPLSIGCYRWIEQPGITLGKILTKKEFISWTRLALPKRPISLASISPRS